MLVAPPWLVGNKGEGGELWLSSRKLRKLKEKTKAIRGAVQNESTTPKSEFSLKISKLILIASSTVARGEPQASHRIKKREAWMYLEMGPTEQGKEVKSASERRKSRYSKWTN
jgi:hypothetical protein